MNESRKPTIDELKEQAQQMEDPEARQRILDALDGIAQGRRVLEWSQERGRQRKQRKAGETRGGARLGAGRPIERGEKASQQVAFRLTPSEAEELLETHGEEGETIHKVCQRLARKALA